MDTHKISALALGQATRKRLVSVAHKASLSKPTDAFSHTYISSPPGLGKTFLVNEALDKAGVNFYEISGNTSMFAFGVRLAVLNMLVPKDQVIIVSVDDCDEILKNEINCNTMKNVLAGMKCYQYEKSLQSQWGSLTEAQQQAIQYHMDPHVIGFRVPTDRFIFIFTSNLELPTDDQVKEARQRSQSKATLMSHRNAIRSRCNTINFDLDMDTHWGWIADVALHTKALDFISVGDREIILEFLWDNWEDMNERSIRTIIKMAEIMASEPKDYVDTWNIQFIK